MEWSASCFEVVVILPGQRASHASSQSVTRDDASDFAAFFLQCCERAHAEGGHDRARDLGLSEFLSRIREKLCVALVVQHDFQVLSGVSGKSGCGSSPRAPQVASPLAAVEMHSAYSCMIMDVGRQWLGRLEGARSLQFAPSEVVAWSQRRC